jgi:hypothetical protein
MTKGESLGEPSLGPKAEAYYGNSERVRRESRKQARFRRKAVAAAVDEKAEVRDGNYWDVVLSALRMGWRIGYRDKEGWEV